MILDTYLTHTMVLTAQNKLRNLICSNLILFSSPCHFLFMFFIFADHKGKLHKQAYASESVLITGLCNMTRFTHCNLNKSACATDLP